MKSHIIAVNLISVLLLGLTSCGSDESPTQNFQVKEQETIDSGQKDPDPTDPLSVSVLNKDTTFGDIKESKTLHIESTLNLTSKVESEYIPEEALIESSCKFVGSEVVYNRTLTTKNPSTIPVASLIPLEVFAADPAALETPPICEVSMEILTDKVTRVQLHLFDLKIEGIGRFSNFQPFSFVNLSPHQELGFNETSTWALSTGFDFDQVSLSCSGEIVSTMNIQSSQSFGALTSQIPKKQSRQECRLLGNSENGKAGIYISPTFHLNGDPGVVKISQRFYLTVKGTAVPGWYPPPPQGPVVIYELKNESPFPAVVRVSKPSSTMSVQMILRRKSKVPGETGMLIHSSPMKTGPILWHLDNQRDDVIVMTNRETNPITIPPNGTLKLSGTAPSVGLQCVSLPSGETYGTGTNYSNLPVIEQNRFSNGKNPVWSTVINDNISQILKGNSYMNYSFWNPSVPPTNGVFERPTGSFGGNLCK